MHTNIGADATAGAGTVYFTWRLLQELVEQPHFRRT